MNQAQDAGTGDIADGYITNQYGEPLPCMNLSLIPEYATATSVGSTTRFLTKDDQSNHQQTMPVDENNAT